MLVRVQTDSVRIDSHIREVDSSILGSLDSAPVRAAAQLGVLQGAANINDVRRAGRRIDRHVVRALVGVAAEAVLE